jgi:hypothetical protein
MPWVFGRSDRTGSTWAAQIRSDVTDCLCSVHRVHFRVLPVQPDPAREGEPILIRFCHNELETALGGTAESN